MQYSPFCKETSSFELLLDPFAPSGEWYWSRSEFWKWKMKTIKIRKQWRKLYINLRNAKIHREKDAAIVSTIAGFPWEDVEANAQNVNLFHEEEEMPGQTVQRSKFDPKIE